MFLKLAFRNLLKRKGYTLINIIGLAIGLVSFMLIMEYVMFERSYDNFHTKGNRIYRVGFDWGEIDYQGVNSSRYATNVPGMGPVLVGDIPEIETYTRFFLVLIMKPFSVLTYRDGDVIRYTGNADQGYYADHNFLNVFTFPIVSGDKDPLAKPNTIVLTESFARKIFGDTPHNQIIGQTIEVDNRNSSEYVVTAIVKDIPGNSHLRFDYLLSWATLNNPPLENNIWWSQFYTYILLKEDADVKRVEAALASTTRKLYGEKSHISIFLQPLPEIYLHSELREEASPPGSEQQLMFLTIIAYAILAMAWINYINMFMARSMERANEVGVKKALGSGQRTLVIQFFTESLLINFVGFAISIMVLLLVQGGFERWLSKDVSSVITGQSWKIGILLIAVLAGSALTGFYPALVLSSYKPIEIIGSKLRGSKSGAVFQKGLVYFQFVISFIVVACTLIVGKQIAFMQDQDIGVTLEECLAVRSPGNVDTLYVNQVKMFKDKMAQYPFVKSVSFTSSIPGKKIATSAGMKRFQGVELDGNNVFKLEVDDNFIKTYNARIIAGRDFSEKLAHESEKVIINEAALSTLKFNSPEEAVNQKVFWGGVQFEIVGVIANYNHFSLQESFEPIMLSYNPAPFGYYTMKIQSSFDQQAIDKARQEMALVFPDNPFDYQHLTSTYASQYKKVEQFDSLTKYFALTSIVISGLGLFALSAYSMQNKTKEVAVRKVYGAEFRDVVVLLSRPYIIMTLLSSGIGSALSIYIMQRWLSNFAFSVELQVLDFVMPLMFILVIVLATLSYNCVKIAITNPSKSLKYE